MTTALTSAVQQLQSLELLSNEQLKEELAKQLELSAGHLLRLALIVQVLENRGEDLSELRIGLIHHLRRIASGQVLPEVVVRFSGSPALLNIVSRLPLTEQQDLASGQPVRLVVPTPEGGYTHRLADPLLLTREQMTQVFAMDHRREDSEQILFLEARRLTPPKEKPKVIGKIKVDRKNKTLYVKRTALPVSDVVEALADLRGINEEPVGDPVSVPVQLSEEEHRLLKTLAAQRGTSMTNLIRSALFASGLLGELS